MIKIVHALSNLYVIDIHTPEKTVFILRRGPFTIKDLRVVMSDHKVSTEKENTLMPYAFFKII